MASHLNRRRFLTRTSGLGAGLMLLPSARSAFAYQANERVNLGLVGVQGYGVYFGFVAGYHLHDNIGVTALCDVDMRKVNSALSIWDQRAREWPGSDKPHERDNADAYVRLAKNRPPLFKDFRRMLDEKDSEIDAVAVATPDHTHAVIAGAALRAGKHTFSEKPLTISPFEARALRKHAAEQGVATTINTHGAAYGSYRRALELLRQGVLGPIDQVHLFFRRGGRGYQQFPDGNEPVPPELAWNLWLAQVAWRDYDPRWINRIAWRGTSIGELGNFGPHTSNLACNAMNIKQLWQRSADQAAAEPIRISAECAEINRISYPKWERIRWELPARGDLPPVTFTWHHGPGPDDYAPGSRKMLTDLLREHGATDEDIKKWLGGAGALIVGSKGVLATTSHNVSYELFPRDRFADVDRGRPETVPLSPGHYHEWIRACRGGPAPMNDFEHATPQAEILTLGEISTRFAGETLDYNTAAGEIVNHAEANAAASYPYRDGWTI